MLDAARSHLARFSGRSVIAGLRPEHLLLAENGAPDTFEAKVEVIEQLGAEIVLEATAKEAEIRVPPVEASTAVQQGSLSPSPPSPAPCSSSRLAARPRSSEAEGGRSGQCLERAKRR